MQHSAIVDRLCLVFDEYGMLGSSTSQKAPISRPKDLPTDTHAHGKSGSSSGVPLNTLSATGVADLARSVSDHLKREPQRAPVRSLYKHPKDWSFPVFGLPACVNAGRVLETLYTKTPMPQVLKRRRQHKVTARTKKLAEIRLRILPIAPEHRRQIQYRHVPYTLAASTRSPRLSLFETLCDCGLADASIEGSIINDYAKAVIGKPIVDASGNVQGVEGARITDDEDTHRMQKMARVLSEPFRGQFHCVDLVSQLAQTELIPSAYSDIENESDKAKKAAAFVFAIGSLMNCRWFLEYVQQRCPEQFAAHYEGLIFDNLEEWERLNEKISEELREQPSKRISEHSTIDRYHKPIAIDLDGGEFIQWLNFGHKYVLLNQIEQLSARTKEAAEISAPDWEKRHELYENLPNIQSALNEIQEAAIKGGQRLQEAIIEVIPMELGRFQERIEEMLSELKEVFHDRDAFPEGPDLKGLAEEYRSLVTENMGRLNHHAKAWHEGISQLKDTFGELEDQHESLVKQRRELEARIEELAKEPIKNRQPICEAYEQLGSLETEAFVEKITALIHDVQRFAETENQRLKDEINQVVNDSEDAAGSEETTLEEQLAESQAQVAQLHERVLKLEAHNQALEHGLAEKNDAYSDGIRDDVRDLIKKAFGAAHTLTPEEALKLLKALYPNVHILPSAWSSAMEAQSFESTDRLWNMLKTLADDYLKKIRSGIPDAEARKVFPSNTFAANESDTTMACKRARKQREWDYNGKNRTFAKHLRIGVADDVRKTIRVHFEVINDALVIAHCGRHQQLR